MKNIKNINSIENDLSDTKITLVSTALHGSNCLVFTAESNPEGPGSVRAEVQSCTRCSGSPAAFYRSRGQIHLLRCSKLNSMENISHFCLLLLSKQKW